MVKGLTRKKGFTTIWYMWSDNNKVEWTKLDVLDKPVSFNRLKEIGVQKVRQAGYKTGRRIEEVDEDGISKIEFENGTFFVEYK